MLCRLFDYAGDPTKAEGKRILRRYADSLLAKGQAGDHNQAMMELGATVCVSKAPLCATCPLSVFCQARSLGTQSLRPLPRRRSQPPLREWVVALPEREGRVLLVRRRPEGLLGGLWELPGGQVARGEDQQSALARHLLDSLAVDVRIGAPLGMIKHAYTHFRLRAHVYASTILGEPTPGRDWDCHHWLAPDERAAHGLTGVTNKILTRLG